MSPARAELALSVVEELPRSNIPATFIFLSQIPVAWATLRLQPAAASLRWQTIRREVAFAAALRALYLVTALALVTAFQAQPYFRWDQVFFPLALLTYTPCFFPFLIYRLLIGGLVAWHRLTERSFLWMLVNSHLVTVLIVIVLAMLLAWFQFGGGSLPAYHSPGVLASLILEFVRTVIPWAGISLAFFSLTVAIFFLPTLLISYLAARRFGRRISDLASAMKEVRQGDLSVRVTPKGQDEVAELQADFNHMAARLQQEQNKVARLLKNQRELSAVVSHELRTPVSVMRCGWRWRITCSTRRRTPGCTWGMCS